MGVFTRMWNSAVTGWHTGWQAALRSFQDPERAYEYQDFLYTRNEYAQRWSRYNNSLFDKASTYDWHRYKQNYKLYRNIRSLQNPCKNLVEFYVASLYPGRISKDGLAFPDGTPSAIPFSDDTDEALIAAIAQIWQWSNWQAKKAMQVRFGGALGDVLSEVVDDVQRGKVYLDLVWPGYLCDLELDHAGNVVSYVLEYPVYENDGRYIFRKEVDKQAFRYFKDGELFDYGNGAVSENVYGFVPATWTKFMDVGGDHGVPAIAGSEALFDELNGLLSMAVDQVEKILRSPSVLWGQVNIPANTPQKRGATNEFTDQQNEQESQMYMRGSAGGHVESLIAPLDFAGVDIVVGRLISAIEDNHPELTLYRKLREMSTITGPAASRLIGDVTSKIQEAQASFDQSNISLWRMAVAIAGMRANNGGWSQLTQQQAKFKPFSLDSYARGDLDMSIMPRPLLSPTALETAMEKQAQWTGVNLAVQAGVPVEIVLEDEGWTEEKLAELKAAKAQERQTQQSSMQQQPQANLLQGDVAKVQ
jgi:hypothetical protein